MPATRSQSKTLAVWCRHPMIPGDVVAITPDVALVGQQLAGPFQQHPQLGRGMRRPHVFDDPLPAVQVHRDLHRRSTRGRAHPQNERTNPPYEPAFDRSRRDP